MVKKDSESFYAKYLRISLPFILLVFLSMQAFAITTTDANYSGGVYNEGFEYGDGNTTTFGFVGDANYGWGMGSSYSPFPTPTTNLMKYDSNILNAHSGNKSMYFLGTMLNRNSSGTVQTYISSTAGYNGSTLITRVATPGRTQSSQAISIKPNTRYYFEVWFKLDYNQGGTISPTVRLTEYNSVFSRVNNPNYYGNVLVSGYQKISKIFTTSVTTQYLTIDLGYRNILNSSADENIAGWWDDVRLEEVGSVPLVGQVSGRPSILVTGVSGNAIDQADTNNSGTSGNFGDNSALARGQCFTPTQNKFKGIIIQKASEIGTYTGDVIVSLRDVDDTNTVPSRTNPVLVQVTIPNATWNAYPIATDILISLPTTINANGVKKYCVDFNSTTQDVNNYPRLRLDSTVGGSYSGGTMVSFNGTVWGTNTTDLYFKTLFEKQSSACDLNVCSSGDSVCESKTYDIDFLEDGETFTINPNDAPLFYEGDNNVYFMMYSDSDYNNKTPSMTAKLTYTFDKPTTTILVEGLGSEKTITLTCTPSVLGACDKTYYNLSGAGYQEYTTPITLTQPDNYTFSYYSTDTGENTEIPTTITITVNPLGERIQNILPSMLQLGFLLLLASIVIGLLSNILIKNEYISLLSVIVGACAIIMIFISILL